MVGNNTINWNEFTELEKINLEKIRAIYGDDFLITRKHNIRYDCPYCENIRGKADKDRKFMIDLSSGAYYCFKCHTKGVLFHTKPGNSEKISQLLLDYYNYEDPINEVKDNTIQHHFLRFDNTTKIIDYSLAYYYLLERHITKEQIEFYNIRDGINENNGRIMIPNLMLGNWTDYYQGRSYLNLEPKYNNPLNIDKSTIVFNLHNQQKHQKRIYIVEGVFSAIRGGKDVVATYGSDISDYQVSLINNYHFDEIYCCYDGDSAGKKGNLLLAEKLGKTNNNVYIINLPEKEDPADMGEEKFKEYCEKNKRKYVNTKLDLILGYFDY